MRFVPGDTVRHRVIGEIGRVVRKVEVDGEEAFVVAILNQTSGREVEVLCRVSEIQEYYPDTEVKRS
jgi:hypothetical protein